MYAESSGQCLHGIRNAPEYCLMQRSFVLTTIFLGVDYPLQALGMLQVSDGLAAMHYQPDKRLQATKSAIKRAASGRCLTHSIACEGRGILDCKTGSQQNAGLEGKHLALMSSALTTA